MHAFRRAQSGWDDLMGFITRQPSWGCHQSRKIFISCNHVPRKSFTFHLHKWLILFKAVHGCASQDSQHQRLQSAWALDRTARLYCLQVLRPGANPTSSKTLLCLIYMPALHPPHRQQHVEKQAVRLLHSSDCQKWTVGILSNNSRHA